MNEHCFKNQNWKIVSFICFITLSIRIGVSLLFSLILEILAPNFANNAINEFGSKIEEFFFVVLLAPIAETLIFQFIPLFYLQKYKPIIGNLVSAGLFGIVHFYNPIYIIHSFFIGLLYVAVYRIADKKGVNPIIVTAFTHMLYNLFVFIWNTL